MALEDIFRALEEQAQQECDQILESARDQAKAIEEDAKDQGEAIRKSKVDEVERLTRRRASQTVNAARLESKKRVAAVKEAAVNAAFDNALDKLGSLRSASTYPAVFKALAEEALARLEGDLEVKVDPADKDLAVRTLADLGVKATVSTDISTRGGLVAATDGGRIMRRNTVEDRLDKVRLMAQADVAEILFS